MLLATFSGIVYGLRFEVGTDDDDDRREQILKLHEFFKDENGIPSPEKALKAIWAPLGVDACDLTKLVDTSWLKGSDSHLPDSTTVSDIQLLPDGVSFTIERTWSGIPFVDNDTDEDELLDRIGSITDMLDGVSFEDDVWESCPDLAEVESAGSGFNFYFEDRLPQV